MQPLVDIKKMTLGGLFDIIDYVDRRISCKKHLRRNFMDYGQKIAELRKGKKMTQADLGVRLNVSPQAVSKWENNLSEPDITSIRKMCEIFGVSVDEFLGLPDRKKEQPAVENSISEERPVKAILAYCAKCEKAVCAGEFTTVKLSYNASATTDKVKVSQTSRSYCHSCLKEITEMQKKEEEKRIESQAAVRREEAKQRFYKGLIWGAIIMCFIGYVGVSSYLSDPSVGIESCIFLTLAGFAIPSQFIWGKENSRLFSVLLFFCRSFKAPFGLIFNLSLDGLIWLLTVKLALWVICGILSILCFLLGLIVVLFASVVLFPFALRDIIKEAF